MNSFFFFSFVTADLRLFGLKIQFYIAIMSLIFRTEFGPKIYIKRYNRKNGKKKYQNIYYKEYLKDISKKKSKNILERMVKNTSEKIAINILKNILKIKKEW